MAGPLAILSGLRRRWHLVFGLALLLAAGLLSWGTHDRSTPVTVRPALWHITKGGHQAYIFGTIHAVPVGARWLSPKIAAAARRSDWLILEVTGLAQERRSQAIFTRLGAQTGLPPVADRIDPADRPTLARLVAQAPDALHDINGYKSWAAAMLIGAAVSGDLSLSARDAPEARLTARFQAWNRPIVGLETIPYQLGLFDHLDAADQRAMLTQAVREAGDAPSQYAALYDAWAAGDVERLRTEFLAPLADQPDLKRAIVDRRNQRWAETINHLLRHQQATPFIAVGAGHLFGPANLLERLSALGWHVERVE